MKKLQSNFTTPEQSKWLLELGVPADSADLYTSLGFENLTWVRNTKNEFSEDFFDAIINGKSAHIPIWSVGRLIEIITICREWFEGQKYHNMTFTKKLAPIDVVILKIEIALQDRSIDFSKLEE